MRSGLARKFRVNSMTFWMKSTYRPISLKTSTSRKKTHVAVRGYINYLKKYEERKATNCEP